MSDLLTLLTVTCSPLTATGISGVKNSLKGPFGRGPIFRGTVLLAFLLKTALAGPVILNPLTYLL